VFALPGVVTSADYGLGVTGSNVPVGRDDADAVRGAAHMEVLGDLLFARTGCSSDRTQAYLSKSYS
jgi:hypothetical protein